MGDLHQKYLGSHTARLNSVVITPPPQSKLLFPMGGFILTYDATSLSKEAEVCVFPDIIMCLLLLPSTQHLVAVSYSGEIALLTQSCQLTHVSHTAQGIATHAALNLSGDKLCTCGEFGNYNGVIEVWSVSPDTGFQVLFQVKGNYTVCEFSHLDDLFALRINPVQHRGRSTLRKNYPLPLDQATEDFSEEAEPTLEELVADLEAHDYQECSYYACLYSVQRIDDRRAVPLEITAGLICCRTDTKKERLAASFQSRVLLVIKMQTLEKLHIVRITGSSGIQSLDYSQDRLTFSPFSGMICSLDTAAASLPEVIDPWSAHYACLTVRNTGIDWVSPDACYIGWIVPEVSVLVFDDCSLHLGEIDPNGDKLKSHRCVSTLQLTACGVALSPKADFVAVGDLSGQLLIAKVTDPMENTSLHQLNDLENLSVRNLLWSALTDEVIIGTLSGAIYLLQNPENPDSHPQEAYFCTESVTVLREKLIDSKAVLAASTVGGELLLFEHLPGALLLTLSFTAHHPQTGHDSSGYFGSLKHFSEVWSLTWSPVPDVGVLATSSEDQTVAIWEVWTQRKVHQLPPHRRAVTGVSWKVLHSGQERLVSCSDDRSVRVYDPSTWALLHVFWTSVIREWHTLTYTDIDSDLDQIVVVSQNGYLFLFSLGTYELTYAKKIHYGSIEGLSLSGKKIATCSSECSICVLTRGNPGLDSSLDLP